MTETIQPASGTLFLRRLAGDAQRRRLEAQQAEEARLARQERNRNPVQVVQSSSGVVAILRERRERALVRIKVTGREVLMTYLTRTRGEQAATGILARIEQPFDGHTGHKSLLNAMVVVHKAADAIDKTEQARRDLRRRLEQSGRGAEVFEHLEKGGHTEFEVDTMYDLVANRYRGDVPTDEVDMTIKQVEAAFNYVTKHRRR